MAKTNPIYIVSTYVKTDSKNSHWLKNILLTKNQQFYSNLAKILAILPTHGLIILTKFDKNGTKLVVYFLPSVIFCNI